MCNTSFVADHGRECHLSFEFWGLKKLKVCEP